MNEIIKNYLYSNYYFLQIKYTCNANDTEYINNYLDNRYKSENKPFIKEVLSTLENISKDIKSTKITIVYKDDLISILEIRNYKIIKYYHKRYIDNIPVEVSYTLRSGLKINMDSIDFTNINSSSFINDIISDDLDLIFNYKKREKEYKTLIKTNDKKKKM